MGFSDTDSQKNSGKGCELDFTAFTYFVATRGDFAPLLLARFKIDRSFVQKMTEQPEHRAIVEAAMSLAQALGLRVVAEGIQTRAQVVALLRQNCDKLQGYLFSPPLHADELLRWHHEFEWQALGLDIRASEAGHARGRNALRRRRGSARALREATGAVAAPSNPW